jgi:hypothetical protein
MLQCFVFVWCSASFNNILYSSACGQIPDKCSLMVLKQLSFFLFFFFNSYFISFLSDRELFYKDEGGMTFEVLWQSKMSPLMSIYRVDKRYYDKIKQQSTSYLNKYVNNYSNKVFNFVTLQDQSFIRTYLTTTEDKFLDKS